MSSRWFGFGLTCNNFRFGFTDPGNFNRFAGFSLPNVNVGDKVTRVLMSYQFQTTIEDADSLSPDYVPVPMGVACWYQPNPQDPQDPTSTDASSALVGDALATATVDWVPCYWTDGTLHGIFWSANSGGMIDCKANRTIQDLETAQIHIGVGQMNLGPDDVNEINLEWSGYVNLRYLVQREGI